MKVSIQDRLQGWELEPLLLKYPGLSVLPSNNDSLRIQGVVSFKLLDDRNSILEDTYQVSIKVPVSFPEQLPSVREIGGRIAKDFHKLYDGSLCLATKLEMELRVSVRPTLLAFVDDFVLPYLYGHSYHVRYARMPFNDRSHGEKGIEEFLAEWFGSQTHKNAGQFLLLASLKKRRANKYKCPCGSSKYLGKCHNNRVNELRLLKGRHWFHAEYKKFQDDSEK